jgi:hypothetical protein
VEDMKHEGQKSKKVSKRKRVDAAKDMEDEGQKARKVSKRKDVGLLSLSSIELCTHIVIA